MTNKEAALIAWELVMLQECIDECANTKDGAMTIANRTQSTIHAILEDEKIKHHFDELYIGEK